MLSLMEVYSMTDTTPLSPAAQAVLDALHTENSTGPERYWARANAAAALRAAAIYCTRERRILLTLADELDGTSTLEPNDLSHLSEEKFQSLAPQGYHAP